MKSSMQALWVVGLLVGVLGLVSWTALSSGVSEGAGPGEEGGTVTGKVLFTGPKPAPEPIQADADPHCADSHKGETFTQQHEVLNADGTLQNVFVYIKDGLGDRKFPAPKEPVVLDQKGCRYYPHVFGIQVRQPLKIVNSDPTLHNIHSMSKDNRQFNVGMPKKGFELQKKFKKPEVPVYIKCEVHPWMNCYAGVVPHPFYSVTGEAGTYTLSDVPAGEYVIEAFHEKWGKLEQKVVVKAGETASADFTYDGKESHLIHKTMQK